ncbi:YceI family protein [Aridibaculum aurantiacum]|uniref:YceI family protein n=1 Tax=Aridibaculum aurantiacum TaxID=2810307 RepID=UPI001A96E61D|nr:YceI family protein [Aridibaculum aurantiacum]
MKRCFILMLTAIALQAQAQVLRMTDETTEVKYVARHLGGRLEGNFKGVQGSAQFDPNALANSYLKLSFATGTVTTNANYVGPNLIKEACFDPAKYPTLELFSTSIKKLQGQNEYEFHGQLKVKGKTRNIAFPMTVTANAGGYDFAFAFKLLRKHFGLDCGATGKDFKIFITSYGKRV